MTTAEYIEVAQHMLEDFQFDKKRQNERSALTFLALAGVREGIEWKDATNEMLTTRQIMDEIEKSFDKHYAPNSRETIRKETLHQFVAGGLVEYNADGDKPVNSPHNNYRICNDGLDVIRAWGTKDYQSKLERFLATRITWIEQQREARIMSRTPVQMPDSAVYYLSHGGQNLLIRDIVEEFCSRYIPDGVVLYLDDTSGQAGIINPDIFCKLGIEIPEHGKAPDLIVYDMTHDLIYMMEACSSHGPIDVIRKRSLLELFEPIQDRMIFVSCFPNRETMRQYLTELAWETEAWCADAPDHVIHLDGIDPMKPYRHT